ncbi:MAG: M48 family metallopeptidase [Planctomycetota bacterium]
MSTDSYKISGTFEGRLRGRQLPGGSVAARLVVTSAGIEAQPEHGPTVTLPLRGLRLRRDENQAVIATDAGAVHSVSCNDPGFLRMLEGAGGNELSDELARLAGQKVASRYSHTFGCLFALLLLGLVVWFVPKMWFKGIDAAVTALPPTVDESLGSAAQEEMDAGGEVLENPVVDAALRTMLDRLQPHDQSGVFKYEFRVVRSDVENAYALPGGYLTVFSALIESADRPEQVAGVLAHEIAHVTQRHGLRRMGHQAGTMVGISLLVGNVSGLEAMAIQFFTLAHVNLYSQAQETNADLEGLRMLHAARIDPSGLIDFFEKLHAEAGDLPVGVQWISTHPDFLGRIQTLREAMANLEPVDYQPLDVDWNTVLEALKP